MRLVTEAQYLEKVKMGKWIWVYDNLNYYRWVRHERKGNCATCTCTMYMYFTKLKYILYINLNYRQAFLHAECDNPSGYYSVLHRHTKAYRADTPSIWKAHWPIRLLLHYTIHISARYERLKRVWPCGDT